MVIGVETQRKGKLLGVTRKIPESDGNIVMPSTATIEIAAYQNNVRNFVATGLKQPMAIFVSNGALIIHTREMRLSSKWSRKANGQRNICRIIFVETQLTRLPLGVTQKILASDGSIVTLSYVKQAPRETVIHREAICQKRQQVQTEVLWCGQ